MGVYPRIEVNGVALDDASGRWAMHPDQQLRGLPGARTSGVAVPGRSGVLWERRITVDTTSFAVSMWVLGSGSTSDARKASLEANLDALAFLFTRDSLQVDYFANVSRVYRAEARFLSASAPQRSPSGDEAVVNFVLEIPDGVWHTPDSYTHVHSGPFASTFVPLTQFDGCTAPITDALIQVKGPCNVLSIADGVTGQSLGCNTDLSSSQYLVIDCLAMTALQTNTDSLTSFTVTKDWSASVVCTGPRSDVSWLNIVPSMDGSDPTSRSVGLRVTVLSGSPRTPSSSARITVQARKAFY